MRLNAVNEFLSFRGHYGNHSGGPMFRQWLAAFIHGESFAEQKILRRERERRMEQDLSGEKQRQKEERDEDELLTVLVVAEEIRRAIDELSRDIEDAIRATRIAYGRAVREQEAAREALDSAQAHAIVLSDGRRVFFTADGRLLFGEDHQNHRQLDHRAGAPTAPCERNDLRNTYRPMERIRRRRGAGPRSRDGARPA